MPNEGRAPCISVFLSVGFFVFVYFVVSGGGGAGVLPAHRANGHTTQHFVLQQCLWPGSVVLPVVGVVVRGR